MPSEKYSPLMLVLRVYLWPVSVPSHSTSARGIGFPSMSLQTPLTLPVVWANAGETDSPTASTSNRGRRRFFMTCLPASELDLLNSLIVRQLNRRRLGRTERDLPRLLRERRAGGVYNCRRH